jgi:hypothetical protein
VSEQGGEVRRLDRAPGERYGAAPEPPRPGGPTRTRRLLAATGVALGTAAVTFLLTGFDVGPGLLAIAGGGGWLTGLALAGGAPPGRGAGAGWRRAGLAAILAGGGVALGLAADGVRALTEGGVLTPWDYALDRFGPLAVAFVAVAAAAAALRGR